MRRGWVWLSTRKVTGVVQVEDHTITAAPPIWRRFLGKPLSDLTAYLEIYGLRIVPID